MIGRRGIRIKRPAVVCTALFAVGILLAQYPVWVLVAAAGGLLGAVCSFLRYLKKGKRRVSVADKLLVLAPLFLLLGVFVMRRESETYTTYQTNFAAAVADGREVLAEGTVAQIKRTKNGIGIELKNARIASYADEEAMYRPVGRLLVYTDSLLAENGELKHGRQVFVYGKGSVFEEAPNPGGFDAKAYYFSLGISGAVQGKSIRITKFSIHRLNQALFQVKYKLLESYVTYLGEEGAGIISSMLLGERSLLSEETQELYRKGGISHILAISGLHVSLLGMALYRCLRKTILGRNGAVPVACAGVLLYGTFVEAGTSTKRAVIMFLLLLLATVLGRTYDTLSAMSVSLLVILWKNPGALYTASLQLSYTAAYGASVIALLLREREKERSPKEKAVLAARRAESRWFRMWETVVRRLKGMFVFGLAIQVVTFPVTLVHFFEYPMYGFFINPIVVPLMTILLCCGFLAGVCGLVVPWLGYFFAGGTGGILWVYERLCEAVGKLPCSLLLFGKPSAIQIMFYFAVLALCLVLWQSDGKNRVKTGTVSMYCKEMLQRTGILWCILLLLPVCLLPVQETKFQVTFLDVGQGDGMVLRERGGAIILVDGGSSSVQNVGEKRMIPYLKSQGIRVIDCAFVSHTDSDHINGLTEILKAMPECSAYRMGTAGYTGTPVIKSLVLPKLAGPGQVYTELVALAKTKKVQLYYLEAGDGMKMGEKLEISCLAPMKDINYADDNAASMVLWVTYGAFDLLLTGDMDRESEAVLLEHEVFQTENTKSGTREPIDVLKVAHHGSYTASAPEFITALKPRISVISCGKGNRYGHPHSETLKTLYEANSEVYRTDEKGCVSVKVGKMIKVKIRLQK